MILDEIVLHNFGVFRGRQRATLTPPSPEKPIILFGGLNGAGKTTLLEGLLIGLYGRNAPTKWTNGSYDSYIRRAIHRSVDPKDGAKVEIRFRAVFEGEEHRYCVSRSWAGKGTRLRETVDVFVNDRLDEALSSTWAEQVERFMPARLAGLYFFDGERIEAFADTEQAAEMLATAMHALLGVDLVEQLGNDLIALERRKRKNGMAGPEREKIQQLEDELKDVDSRLDGLRQDVASHRARRDREENLFRKLDQQYSESGGDLLEQHKAIEREQGEVSARLGAVEADLLEMAHGELPLALTRGLLRRAAEQAEREGNAARDTILLETLSTRDDQLVSVLHDAGARTEAIAAATRFLETDRETRANSSRCERYLELSAPAAAATTFLLDQGLEAAVDRAGRLLDQAHEHALSVESLESKLAAVPDEESLTQLIETRARARHVLEERELALKQAELEASEAERIRDKMATSLERFLEAQGDAKLHNKDLERYVTHSESVRKALKSFRTSVVARHLERLEGLILECYLQLLRKKTLVHSIRIHPDSYALDIRNRNGDHITPDRLSAGERQLLAVAILWALARASGRSLPIAVDTPLGRLDAPHRKNLVEGYFPYASHQILLLSTDEEIDEKYYGALKNRIGHAYRLEYDDETASSRIQPGYFW